MGECRFTPNTQIASYIRELSNQVEMDKATQTMIENLRKNTGKSLEKWVVIAQKSNLVKHGEIIKMLKEQHGLTHGYANLVALTARDARTDLSPGDDLVAEQYKGKEDLRPIYDKILSYVETLGKDIEVAPKKSSVSLRRKRQFALVQPSTKTRIDLGLKFNNKPHAGRLETSGPFGTMCTHRVQLTDMKDVDKQVMDWIREAYDEAG
jgi:predicted transport protein